MSIATSSHSDAAVRRISASMPKGNMVPRTVVAVAGAAALVHEDRDQLVIRRSNHRVAIRRCAISLRRTIGRALAADACSSDDFTLSAYADIIKLWTQTSASSRKAPEPSAGNRQLCRQKHRRVPCHGLFVGRSLCRSLQRRTVIRWQHDSAQVQRKREAELATGIIICSCTYIDA